MTLSTNPCKGRIPESGHSKNISAVLDLLQSSQNYFRPTGKKKVGKARIAVLHLLQPYKKLTFSNRFRPTGKRILTSRIKAEFLKPAMDGGGGGDSSVVRAPDSWLKGRGFQSLLERRENFLLQGRLTVLTLISVPVPPPCYHSST